MRYQITQGILAQSIGDTIVLFHPETERILTLHETGVRIWELLSDGAEAEQIVRRLIDEYTGSGALIQQQALAFLAQLESEQVIRREG